MKIELYSGVFGLILLGLYGCGLKKTLDFPSANKNADTHQLMITQSSSWTSMQTITPPSRKNDIDHSAE